MCRVDSPAKVEICQIESQYARTGDSSLVGKAIELAPHVAFQARRALQARGEIPR